MFVLSAKEIDYERMSGRLRWTGELRGDSLLLKLGPVIQRLRRTSSGVVDLADQAAIDEAYSSPDETWQATLISSREVLLVRVSDELRLDGSLFGLISGLSHLARIGLAIHITSPAVMPRWRGYLTLELTNLGPSALRIYRDMPAGRLVLFKVDGGTGGSARHEHYGSGVHMGSRYASELED